MRALNRNVERVFNPDRKDHYWAAGSWRATNDAGMADAEGLAPRPPFRAARRTADIRMSEPFANQDRADVPAAC
jgi:hypothetical protein